jgi:hypothetical protein
MSAGKPSTGLWGSISTSEGQTESADDIVPNFEDPKPISSTARRSQEALRVGERFPAQQALERPQSQPGLWGSVSILQDWEPFAKRRWTVTERQE